MNTRDDILCILEENGIYVEIEDGKDIDLREYIADSFQFISFIIEIEEKLEFEFPDEFLVFDKISSLNGFSKIIEEILNEN